MKLNTDKCHLLMSGLKYEHFWAQIGKQKIWEDNEVKLLGITIRVSPSGGDWGESPPTTRKIGLSPHCKVTPRTLNLLTSVIPPEG